MVDSGADDCLFPRSFLQPLGLDPLTLPVDFTGGVGNSRNATQYANITVDIQGIARSSTSTQDSPLAWIPTDLDCSDSAAFLIA